MGITRSASAGALELLRAQLALQDNEEGEELNEEEDDGLGEDDENDEDEEKEPEEGEGETT